MKNIVRQIAPKLVLALALTFFTTLAYAQSANQPSAHPKATTAPATAKPAHPVVLPAGSVKAVPLGADGKPLPHSNSSADNVITVPNSSKATVSTQPTMNKAVSALKFDNIEFNFGTIKQGEEVTHEYKFTNTSDKPISLLSVRASCGCTTPDYPTTPIKPGETSKITAKFNSANKLGGQNKTITVKTSEGESSDTGGAIIILSIKGEITPNTPPKSGN